MRGTGALARASMADLKPDRVRAAELAQTGAGRGRARGEKIEREHESTRTLFEHLNPSELAVVPSGMRPKNFVGIESLVSVGVGSSERESDDSVSVDTNASHSTDLSGTSRGVVICERLVLPAPTAAVLVLLGPSA